MLLRLQRYNYKLVYKPGSQLILADAFVSSYAGKRHRLSPAKMNQTKFDKETVRKETQNCCMVTDVTTYPYEMVTDLNISVGLSYWSTKQCCEQNFCLFVPTCHILGVHKSQMMQEIEFTFKCLSPVYVALYPPYSINDYRCWLANLAYVTNDMMYRQLFNSNDNTITYDTLSSLCPIPTPTTFDCPSTQ